MNLPTKIEQADAACSVPAWELELQRRLALFGHRNWIVVADAAYPAQSNPGIETIAAGTDQLPILEAVLGRIAASAHVRANIYIDQELEFLEEQDAPGIASYRRELRALLKDIGAQKLPHEQIIARLDQCAKVFKVLIIKTNLTLPYTSVFLELDCGYWSADAENRLRKAMQQEQP